MSLDQTDYTIHARQHVTSRLFIFGAVVLGLMTFAFWDRNPWVTTLGLLIVTAELIAASIVLHHTSQTDGLVPAFTRYAFYITSGLAAGLAVSGLILSFTTN